jgi:hypothetical protein
VAPGAGAEARGVIQPLEDDRDDGLERLGESEPFAAYLERLAENAPEPFRLQLSELARQAREEGSAT